MQDRFDQEFYRSQWQRVLPVGPDGIQPYVHTGRASSLSAPSPALRLSQTTLAGLGRRAIALWRWMVIDRAKRRLLTAGAGRQPSLRLAPETTRPDVREPRTPPPLSRAA